MALAVALGIARGYAPPALLDRARTLTMVVLPSRICCSSLSY